MKVILIQFLLFSFAYNINALPNVKDSINDTKKQVKQKCENCPLLLDKTKIRLEDSIQKIHLNKKLNSIISDYQTSLFKVLPEETNKKEFTAFNKTITDFHKNSNTKIVRKKNTAIFKQLDLNIKLNEKLEKEGINYKLIIILILSAGIIGGWARTNWHLLDYIENTVSELKKQIEECKKLIPKPAPPTKKDIGAAEILFSLQNESKLEKMNSIEEKLITVETEIKNSKKDEKQPLKMLTNMAFGIIASSISVLALYAVDSKLLDFEKTIHYFVFWGWCVLGAVFARDWVERGYKIISSRWNKTNS